METRRIYRERRVSNFAADKPETQSAWTTDCLLCCVVCVCVRWEGEELSARVINPRNTRCRQVPTSPVGRALYVSLISIVEISQHRIVTRPLDVCAKAFTLASRLVSFLFPSHTLFFLFSSILAISIFRNFSQLNIEFLWIIPRMASSS